MNRTGRLGLAGTIAQAFIGSTLTPLLVIGSILLGILAIVVLPREEEPQIKVPVVDILVRLSRYATLRATSGGNRALILLDFALVIRTV